MALLLLACMLGIIYEIRRRKISTGNKYLLTIVLGSYVSNAWQFMLL